MGDPGRFKKADPARTGPYRHFYANIFRSESAADAGGESNGAGDPGWTSVIERTVKAGYRIVDEQLTLGREAAERLGAGFTGGRPDGAGGGLEQMTLRMMRSTLDLAGVWVELMSSVPDSMGSWISQATPATGSAGSAQAPGPAGAPPVVSVRSDRPVEVDLDLDARWSPATLAIQALRPLAGDPVLEGVKMGTAEDGRVRLSVEVGSDLPSGVYTGAICDASSGVGRGTLSVRVG